METSDLNSVFAHLGAKKLRRGGRLVGEGVVKRTVRHGKEAWGWQVRHGGRAEEGNCRCRVAALQVRHGTGWVHAIWKPYHGRGSFEQEHKGGTDPSKLSLGESV